MSRRKHDVSAEKILQRIVQAGVKDNEIIKRCSEDEESQLDSLPDRIKKLLTISDNQRKCTDMLFFVMYDIAHNNKCYNLIESILLRGCKGNIF